MTVEYRTVRDATEAWVHEMNAIPQGMIEKLMGMNPDDWTEVTKPSTGDRVYVYEKPVPFAAGSSNRKTRILSFWMSMASLSESFVTSTGDTRLPPIAS